jgi:hypothetical protein
MNRHLFQPVFVFFVLYALIATIHLLLISEVLPVAYSDPHIKNAYILFSLYTAVLMIYLLVVRKKDPVKAGWAYLAGGMFKMFLALFYVLPIIKNRPENMKHVVLQVVFVFFIGLMIEVFVLFRWFNKSDKPDL